MRWLILVICGVAASVGASGMAHAADLNPAAVAYTLPDKIAWKATGSGSEQAVLVGDPSKPGLYIQLIKWHPGNMSRPHSHSTARYIMVLSGTWWIGTGNKYDPDSTFPVKAGTYVIDQPNELHYDGAKDEECVLYLIGMGPVVTTQAAGNAK